MSHAVTCTIDFNVNDSPQSVVAFLRRLAHVFDPDTRGWHLDLSKCAYLGPDGAAIIVATFLEAHQRGVDARVSLPVGHPSLDAFLEFSGVKHHLTGSAMPTSGHPENVTIPVRIQTASSFRDPDPIIGLIAKHAQISADAEEYLRICINEVIQNVEDHAASPVGCVTCARFMRNAGQVRVAIVDRGRGIGTTLGTRYPYINNATEGLKRVIEGGYSAKSRANNMGLGISNLCGITINELGGEVFIVSEDSYADGKPGSKPFARTMGTRFPGTGVFFTIPVQ